MFLFFSLHLPTNYLCTVLGCMTRDTGIWYYLLQDKFNLFVGENGISSCEWTWRHVPAVTEGIKINNWSTCYCLDLFSHIPHSDVWVVDSLQLSGLHFIKNVPNRPCFPAHEEPHSCQSSASHHLKIVYLICFLDCIRERVGNMQQE